MTHSKLRIVLVAILLSGLFPSCAEDDNPAAPQTPQEIMPLRIGNAWAYQLSNYDASGAVLSTGMMTASILNDTLIDNETWYEFGPRSPGSEFFMVKADGLWYRQRNVSIPGLMAKYPTFPGDVFTEQHDDTVRVLSIDREVVVSAGVFRCHVYEVTTELNAGAGVRLRHRRSFSPGVGMVLMQQYIQYGDDPEYLRYTAELTSFVPAP